MADVLFTGVSCERSSASTNLHPKPGRLRVQLTYHDLGDSPIGSSFGIHGIIDEVDPVIESMFCIGDKPAPGGNELTLMGRDRLVSSAPEGFPSSCPAHETQTTPLCRFEVTVRDNDMNGGPGMGDYFEIRLSSGTVLGELDPATVFYTAPACYRNGTLRLISVT